LVGHQVAAILADSQSLSATAEKRQPGVILIERQKQQTNQGRQWGRTIPMNYRISRQRYEARQGKELRDQPKRNIMLSSYEVELNARRCGQVRPHP